MQHIETYKSRVKMLILPNSREGQLVDSSKKIVATSANIDQEHLIKSHQHCRAQLLMTSKNHINVVISDKSWLLTPNYAIWIPSNVPHETSAAGPTTYRSVFIEPSIAKLFYKFPVFLQLTPLFIELVSQSATFGIRYKEKSAENRLNTVLLDQLPGLSRTLLPISMPGDLRLIPICRQLTANPGDSRELSEWSKNCGASSRTLSRLFVAETGFSFTEWRQRLRVLVAIELIAKGLSVTSAALELGYNSSASFSTMFKKVVGRSPTQYFS